MKWEIRVVILGKDVIFLAPPKLANIWSPENDDGTYLINYLYSDDLLNLRKKNNFNSYLK